MDKIGLYPENHPEKKFLEREEALIRYHRYVAAKEQEVEPKAKP